MSLKLSIKIGLFSSIFPLIALAETYTVQKGDTLENIARKFNVSVEEIKKANNIKDEKKIRDGTKLKIPTKKTNSKVESKKTSKKESKRNKKSIYIVQKGDALEEIAKKYGLTVKELMDYNDMKDEKIFVGDELKIPPKGAKIAQKQEQKEQEKRDLSSCEVYVLKRGGTLKDVSKKLGVSVKTLEKLNNISANKRLKAGEKVCYGQRLKPATATIKTEQPEKPREKEKPEETLGKVETKQPPLPKPVEPKETEKETVNLEGVKLSWPVEGNVIAKFQNDEQVRHLGIDIETDCDQSVKAAADGKVIYAGDGIKAFGNLVVIRHSNKLTTVYGYLDDIFVREGNVVNTGDVIGKVGKLKDSDKCGIYFEVRKNVTPIDPLNILETKE
jgi:murein DD-endopeptidase MepM/ murein hydrolase activator NlpD